MNTNLNFIRWQRFWSLHFLLDTRFWRFQWVFHRLLLPFELHFQFIVGFCTFSISFLVTGWNLTTQKSAMTDQTSLKRSANPQLQSRVQYPSTFRHKNSAKVVRHSIYLQCQREGHFFPTLALASNSFTAEFCLNCSLEMSVWSDVVDINKSCGDSSTWKPVEVESEDALVFITRLQTGESLTLWKLSSDFTFSGFSFLTWIDSCFDSWTFALLGRKFGDDPGIGDVQDLACVSINSVLLASLTEYTFGEIINRVKFARLSEPTGAMQPKWFEPTLVSILELLIFLDAS